FTIGDPSLIEVGPATPTPFPGLIAHSLVVNDGKGHTVRSVAYSDASGKNVILGQMFDLAADPWNRVDTKALHLNDRPTMGPPEAPVTIIEFADFECPHCARAFSTIETLAHSTYKGKVKVIFKNYPLNGHPWAVR